MEFWLVEAVIDYEGHSDLYAFATQAEAHEKARILCDEDEWDSKSYYVRGPCKFGVNILSGVKAVKVRKK